MKTASKIMIMFFIIGIFLGGLFILDSYSSETEKLRDGIDDILVNIAKSKTEEINSYLSEIEENIKTLQKSNEVKELLKQELVFDESIIKLGVDERARIISKGLENYLRVHTEMTLKDLQESSEFQQIAVQPVGKEGYSFLFDSQSLINYFHKEPRRVGYDYNNMEKTFPELWDMFKETSEKSFSEGFYYRDEPDGSISYKYGRFVQIPVKTADGISMSVGTTTYVNDYKIIKEESEYLENFKEGLNYHNLILVSSEGYIIYMVKPMEDFGTNLGWELNLREGLSKNYFDVKESEKISFFGLSIRHYEDVYPKISVMAPVYGGDNLLGYIGLIDEAEKVFEITEDTKNLGETGETYLINDEKFLISPSRNSDFDIMIQSVDTENAQNCFNETFPGHVHGEEPIVPFLDYLGEVVFGTHREISGTDWCLLIEIDKAEVSIPMKEFLRNRIIFVAVIILILSLIGFFIGNYFGKKNNKRKIKKYPCGIRRKFQPWYCKLMKGKCHTYPNGRCGAVIKTRNFFTNLRLVYYLLFALIFAVGYFFIVTSFFQGWQNARLLDAVPDLIFFIIAFSIFAYAFKLKNKARKLLVWGAGLLCLVKVYEIPLQELQAIETISPFLWYPSMIISVLSFLLILVFFKEVLK